jgi:hypothetical protein
LHGNLPRDATRHAAGHAALNLARHATGLVPARLIGDGPRNAIGNAASAGLLNHRARLVRNSSRIALFDHLAGGVWNSTRAALFDDAAAGIRNSTLAALLDHRASRVRNLPATNLLFGAADRVRNALRHRAGHLIAARVRDLALLHLLHIPGAGDLLFFDARAPDLLAADRRRALHLFGAAATRPVAAAAGAGIPFPRAGILHAAAHHRSGNAFLNRFPFAGADLDALGFAYRAASRVTDVAVARLAAGAVSRAANVLIAGLINGTADGVTAFPIAGLVHRSADGVTLFAEIRFINRPPHHAALFAEARLIDGAADFTADVAIAGLIDRAADSVALVAVTGVVDGFTAGHGDRFANRVVDRLGAGVILLFPDDFVDSLVTGLAGRRGGATGSGRSARWRAGGVACSSAIARVDRSAGARHIKENGKRANSKAGGHNGNSSPR